MTLPTFIAAGADSSAASAISVAWPAGHQADDIGLLFVQTANEAVPSTPSGWTELSTSPQGTGTPAAAGAPRLTTYWRRATSSSEANASVGDSGNHQMGVILVYRGCVTSGDPTNVSSGNIKASASTSTTFDAVTTTVADCIVVLAIATATSSTGATFSAWANASLSSLTERFDQGRASGVREQIGIADGGFAGPGNTGTSTVTSGSSASAFYTIALASPNSGAISGSASLAFATAAALTGATALTGTASLALGTAATISPAQSSGTTAFSFAAAGTLAAVGALAGTAALQFTPTAAISAKASITGTTTLGFAVSAALQYGAYFRSLFQAVALARQTLQSKIVERTNTIATSSDDVLNPGFENGTTFWSFGSGWVVEANALAISGAYVAYKTGGSSPTDISNAGRKPCLAGARVTVTASVRSAASADGSIGPSLWWYDSSGSLLSKSENAYLAAASCASTWVQARNTFVAPANTAWCIAAVHLSGYSTGQWRVDQVGMDVQPQTQTDLNPIGVGSINSRWDGLTISYSVGSTSTTVTINVSAATLRAGSASISYSSSSGTVTQARSTTVTYQLYYHDANYSGGARTLNITTDPNNLANSDDVIWVGSVDVTVPASGSGGSGGGGVGGGCVATTMWLDDARQASDIAIGDWIECAMPMPQAEITQSLRVQRNRTVVQPCHRIVTTSGAAVCASDSTPMTLVDGAVRYMPEMLGQLALVKDVDGLRWERVVKCYPIGLMPVAHISVHDSCYFAGEHPDRRIATHNAHEKP